MKPPKQKSLSALQKEVDDFNANYKVGETVKVKTDDGNVIEDVVRHEATIMDGHTAMAWLQIKGCYLLERVSKVTVPAIFLLCLTVSAIAQTKPNDPQRPVTIPDTFQFKLPRQVVLRMDSAINTAAQTLDSKAMSQWFSASFVAFYKEIQKQVKDKNKGKN